MATIESREIHPYFEVQLCQSQEAFGTENEVKLTVADVDGFPAVAKCVTALVALLPDDLDHEIVLRRSSIVVRTFPSESAAVNAGNTVAECDGLLDSL